GIRIPPAMGCRAHENVRRQSKRRARVRDRKRRLHRTTSALTADPLASRGNARRALGVASGAHALFDGFSDLLYVLLPIWQAEVGLGYAEIGALRRALFGAVGDLANS